MKYVEMGFIIMLLHMHRELRVLLVMLDTGGDSTEIDDSLVIIGRKNCL